MESLLPDEILTSLSDRIQCRELQIRQLVGLLDVRFRPHRALSP